MLLIGFRNLGREMRVLKVVPRATCRARWLVMVTPAPAPAPSVRWPEPECRMMHMCGLSHLDTRHLPPTSRKNKIKRKKNKENLKVPHASRVLGSRGHEVRV